MDRATFQQLLDDPAALLGMPIAELEGLSLTYPYSTNLRLLLLLKARLDDHPRREDYLGRMAAATFDRAHLYDLLRELDKKKVLADETLELIGLEELAEEQLAEPTSTALPSRMNEMPPPPVASAPTLEAVEEAPVPPTPAAPPVSKSPVPADWASMAADFAASLPDPDTPAPAAPERIDAFAAHLPPAPPLRQRLRDLRRKTLPRPVSPADRNVDRIAHESVVDHAEVASETLAQLLVRQGQYRNAIRMYRRLSLLNPEKKAIFAGLIEELKEKL